MNWGKLTVLIVFMFILGSMCASGLRVTITAPNVGTYVKQGSTIAVKFTVQDQNVDGNSPMQLGVQLYYSKTSGTFEKFVKDYNLSDESAGYCPDTNFLDETACTINWSVPAGMDGNYFFDLNFYDYNSSSTQVQDTNKVSSASFYVDNNAPSIKVIEPSAKCEYGICTDNQRVMFDLNDFGSGVNVSTASISVEGSPSTSFKPSEACTAVDGNYHCDYNELAINKNLSSYTILINASDSVGNKQTYSFSVTYLDTNAPEKPDLYSATPGAGKITLEWSSSKANDLNGYKVYYSTESCDFNKQSGTYAGFSKQNSFTLNDLNSDLNYYAKVTAIDISGNESEMSNCIMQKPNPVAAPNAPTLTSSTHTNNSWSNKKDVKITWNAVTNATGYSCTWGTSGTDPDQTINTESWCKDRSLQQNNLSDGTYYLKVRACASNGNCSSISTFTVKIDTVKPTEPANFSASLESNSKVKLTWNSSSDSGSGVKEYRIYRGTSSDFTADSGSRIATVTGTSYEDSDVSTGKTYYYKLKAVDNAGNESDLASTSITTQAIGVTISVPAYVKAGSTTIEISASSTLKNAYVYIKKPGSTVWTEIAGPKTSSDFSISYEFAEGENGIAKVKVTADNLTNEVTKIFEVDTTAPKLSWVSPKPGEKITGIYTLKVKTEDPATKLKGVSFYYNDTKIADVTQAAEQNIYWVANWDTNKLSAGSYTLKAVAEDKAGNKGTASITVAVEKPVTEKAKKKKESETKIETISKAKEQAVITMQRAKSFGLPVSSSTEKLYADASALIEQANKYYSAGNYTKALQTAEEAEKKLGQLSENFGFSEAQTEVKEISGENAASMLKAQGFSDEAINEAKTTMSKVGAKKIVKVLMLKDANVERYYVKVFLQFKADSNKLKVIDVIPKALAKSSKDIDSNVPFDVLKEDPVIAFRLEGISPGSFTIEYSLKEPLNKSSYEQLKKAKAFEPAPFAVIEEKVKKAAATNRPAKAAFPWFALGVFLLVLIIIGGVAFFYFTYTKEGQKEKIGLERAIASLEKRTRFALPGIKIGKKQGIRKRGKWAYKGK